MQEDPGSTADEAPATSLVELPSGLEVPDLLVEQHLLGRLEQVLAATRDGAAGDQELVPSVLPVPVRARGRVVGTLNLARSRPGDWSERQVLACQAYADVIGVLLSLSAPGSRGSGGPA